MSRQLSFVFLFVCTGPLLAQSPSPTPGKTPAPPAQRVHSSGAGFSYGLPADWDVVESKSSSPDVQHQVEKQATSEAEKRGINCAQIVLTARHGDPASMVVVVALPFDCFGEQLSEKDLLGFAQGASEGITNSFDISEPVYGTYSLGSHSMWIERSKGSLKSEPELQYTVETVCSVLKKGAVCWLAMAADKEGLATFEGGAVTLDGDAQPALVPATAFEKKPS